MEEKQRTPTIPVFGGNDCSAVMRRTPPKARAVVWTLLLTVSLLAACTPNSPAFPKRIDFTKIPHPTNFVSARRLRPQLDVPPLLFEACSPNRATDPPDEYGENTLYHMVAEVTLLKMLQNHSGATAINAAIASHFEGSQIYSAKGGCLESLAGPDWADASKGKVNLGWTIVANELRAAPNYAPTPGTDSFPCNKAGDGDIAIALMERVWLMSDAALNALDPGGYRDLETRVARFAWLYGGTASSDTVVCSIAGADIPETENHTFLIEVGRALHNDHLSVMPIPSFNAPGPGHVTGDYLKNLDTNNATNGVTQTLHSLLTGWIQHDFIEYNARPYGRYQVVGLLDLYDFSKDPVIRTDARAVLNLLSAKDATEAVDEMRAPPFRRRTSYDNDRLFEGDSTSPIIGMWLGDIGAEGDPDASFAAEMALGASTTYLPPDQLTDLALNPADHEFLQTFNGRGQDERAFGAPEYTISGGGLRTNCPYPAGQGLVQPLGPCPGSGNDDGTTMPIAVIARLSTLSGLELPKVSYFVHSSGTGDSDCIAIAFACAARFDGGTLPSCHEAGRTGEGDTQQAWRFDPDCSGTGFERVCFFVYSRTFGNTPTIGPPLSYLVTHTCDPKTDPIHRTQQFDDFVHFLTNGPGNPQTRPPTSQECAGYGKGRGGAITTPFACGYSMRIVIPQESGAIVPAATRTFGVSATARYSTAAPDGAAAQAAWGDVIREHDSPRVALEIGSGLEHYLEFMDSVNPALTSADDPFNPDVHASLGGSGQLNVSVSSVPEPEFVHQITISWVDETKVAADCTVTLSNGQQACLNTGALCGNPPIPCSANLPAADKPHILEALTYDAEASPFAIGGSLSVTTSIGSFDPSHHYNVEFCADWWRFMTPQQLQNDPAGTFNQDAHGTCTNKTPTTPFCPDVRGCLGEVPLRVGKGTR